MKVKGTVYLIGAGPGAPDLITVRGRGLLAEVDVVVYDRLVNESLLEETGGDCERIFVGKRPGHQAMSQEEINDLLVSLASSGKKVARLKGGDPYVFGRGGEEALHLARAGVRFEEVPGVSASVAVPAFAGIPVTHRGLASCFTVVTGHEDPGKPGSSVPWSQLSQMSGTLVFLMGVGNLTEIAESLIRYGKAPETPAAAIRWGTYPAQSTLVGTLEDIAEQAAGAHFSPPAVIVVGEVVRLRPSLSWFEGLPLFGKRVLITRPFEQSRELVTLLYRRGAEGLALPAIQVRAPEIWEPVDTALHRLSTYDFVVFTSANGVRFIMARLDELGRDARDFAMVQLAAIGPATAAELRLHGLRADFLPPDYLSDSLGTTMPAVAGKRMLLLRADIATEGLRQRLEERGALVDEVAAYRTVRARLEEARLAGLVENGPIDVATFTSSSAVRGFVEMVDGLRGPGAGRELLACSLVACIGPVTAATAEEYGLRPGVVAREHTVDGLVAAIEEYCLAAASMANGGNHGGGECCPDRKLE